MLLWMASNLRSPVGILDMIHHTQFMQGCWQILSCMHTRPRFYWIWLCPHMNWKLLSWIFLFLPHPYRSIAIAYRVNLLLVPVSETPSLGHPTSICTLHYAGLPNVGTFCFTVPAPTLFFNTIQKCPSRTKLRCSRWWARVISKSKSWLKFILCR